MKRSVRIALWLALALLVLGALAAAAAASWAWRELERERPVDASPQQPVVVEIEPGSSAGRILAQLFERGAIADPRLARLWLVYGMGDPPLQAGEYSIESPATTEEILGKLVAGDVVLHRATVIEGLTLEETAQSLSAQGFGDEEALLAAMRRPDAIRDLDPDATTLEGYLFPDTYAFPRGTDEAAVVKRMVDTFRRRLDQSVRSETPVENVRDLVTLASIVESEAQLDEERSMIAGTYANRLRIGMGLYADPTVIYALKERGEWDGNLRRDDLEIDSPYNTYRYPGLPPGPICSPGLGSLLAAARPADVPYLYFVSRNDGSHVFAETLAEHNRNVDRWQRRYWRERWARERAEESGGR